MRKIYLFFLVCFLFLTNLNAQETTQIPFEKRANDLINILNEPNDLEKVFSKSFLGQVPAEQVIQISQKLTDDHGKALKVEKIEKNDEFSGDVTILFDKNVLIKFGLVIESSGENLIVGLLVKSIDKKTDSLENFVEDLKKFSGKTSLTVAKLTEKGSENLISYNSDEQFAVGSTFKLYVLGELVRQISVGRRKWSDVVELTQFSLPSGQMQEWENSSPVTLHTLASLMISVSDNTATDQLIKTLGRENIEKFMQTAGNSKPEKTKPFLMTSEMFLLKGVNDLEYAKKFAAADEKGKRSILANEIAKTKLGDIDIKNFLKKPTYISEIEWFASGNDLVRLMNWLKINSEKSILNKARGVMTINKGLSEENSEKWNYVGYKGGSEPGVISMTFLLQSKKGEWFVLSASWNDEKETVKEAEFIVLVQSAVNILAEKTK